MRTRSHFGSSRLDPTCATQGLCRALALIMSSAQLAARRAAQLCAAQSFVDRHPQFSLAVDSLSVLCGITGKTLDGRNMVHLERYVTGRAFRTASAAEALRAPFRGGLDLPTYSGSTDLSWIPVPRGLCDRVVALTEALKLHASLSSFFGQEFHTLGAAIRVAAPLLSASALAAAWGTAHQANCARHVHLFDVQESFSAPGSSAVRFCSIGECVEYMPTEPSCFVGAADCWEPAPPPAPLVSALKRTPLKANAAIFVPGTSADGAVGSCDDHICAEPSDKVVSSPLPQSRDDAFQAFLINSFFDDLLADGKAYTDEEAWTDALRVELCLCLDRHQHLVAGFTDLVALLRDVHNPEINDITMSGTAIRRLLQRRTPLTRPAGASESCPTS